MKYRIQNLINGHLASDQLFIDRVLDTETIYHVDGSVETIKFNKCGKVIKTTTRDHAC